MGETDKNAKSINTNKMRRNPSIIGNGGSSFIKSSKLTLISHENNNNNFEGLCAYATVLFSLRLNF